MGYRKGITTALFLVFLAVELPAQWMIGFGGGAEMPLNQDFRARNQATYQVEASILSRYNCCWWYGVRLCYSQLQRNETAPTTLQNFQDQTLIAGHLRWYPTDPQIRPLYFAAEIEISDVAVSNATPLIPPTSDLSRSSSSALGLNISLGYLFMYDCTKSWFFDAHVDALGINLLEHAKQRGQLFGLAAGLRFNFTL